MGDWFGFVVAMTLLLGVVVTFYLTTARDARADRKRRGNAVAAPSGASASAGGDREHLSVLVLSAAMGGGHNAAARAVASALEARGHQVVIVDGLHQMSAGFDSTLQSVYSAQLRYAPWSYDLCFHLFALPGVRDLLRLLSGLLYGRRLSRIIGEQQPNLIVSTYPLVTAALGFLRRRGRLDVPVAAIVSDFGNHPMWVAPGVDQHLVVSATAIDVARSVGGMVQVVEPLIGSEFRDRYEREAARAELGLPTEGFLALIVGGAWGVGDLEGAAAQVVAAGADAVVVTGRNERLRKHLTERFAAEPRKGGLAGQVRVLGWTDEMPRLMAASDCLIQNAGGITCLEAIGAGLPIVIFEPIPGHGRLNATRMERAGVAVWARSATELRGLIIAAASGAAPLPSARREPSRPLGAAVLDTLSAPSLAPSWSRAPTRGHRWASLGRVALSGTAAAALLLTLTFSNWGIALAAHGLRMDLPGYDTPPGIVAVAVRVTDPTTAADVERMIQEQQLPVAIFADEAGARGLHPADGVLFGVAETPHGGGRAIPEPWRAREQTQDTAELLRQTTGVAAGYFLPATGDVNLTALALVPSHTHLVVPEHTIDTVHPGVFVVDLSGVAPSQASSTLLRQLNTIQEKGFQCVELDQLSS